MLDTILGFFAGMGGISVYAAIFGLLLACGLGVPLPEDITLLTAGYLAADEIISLPGAIGICLAGVLIGDSLIFTIGRRFGEHALDTPGIRTVFSAKRMERGHHYFELYGKKMVFFGRFIAGMRAPIFLMAGILKMPYRTFILLDGIGALLSVPLLTWLGWYFAEDVHHVFQLVRSSHNAMLLALAIGLGIAILLSSFGALERILIEKSLGRVEKRHSEGDDQA